MQGAKVDPTRKYIERKPEGLKINHGVELRKIYQHLGWDGIKKYVEKCKEINQRMEEQAKLLSEQIKAVKHTDPLAEQKNELTKLS